MERDLSPWPILVDESGRTYGYYGMGKATFFDLWNPATLWLYFLELLKGKRPHAPHGDIHQRGGDVLIDPAGEIRLKHVGRGPADRPSVDTILTKLK